MSTTWKALASSNKQKIEFSDDDDWETDGNFENNVTEQEQRWGSKTVEGSGRIVENVNFQKVIEEIQQEDKKVKQQYIHESQTDAAKGFGGSFGVQQDRVDKSAVGWDYHTELNKHESQKDYSYGFGGKYKIQKDRVDKSAVDWNHHEKIEKHESQKDYKTGFGGSFGVQKDRVDKSAVDWNYHEKVEKHESQKDYKTGFGGQFGVQKDRVDKSALDWNYHEKIEKHASQISTDKRPSVGKIKVPDFEAQQPEKPEKPANDKPTGKVKVPNFVENPEPRQPAHKSTPVSAGKLKLPETFTRSNEEERNTPTAKERPVANNSANRGNASALKSKFENLIKESDSENQRKIEEERLRRTQKESMEKNKAKQEEEERQKKLRLEAEQRKSSEPPAANQNDESSSDDEQVVSSKVNKIGVSVLPTQISAGSLSKQNSKASNRSSSYDSDTENNNTFDDEESNAQAVAAPTTNNAINNANNNVNNNQNNHQNKQSNERVEASQTVAAAAPPANEQAIGRQAVERDEQQQTLIDQQEIDRLRELELQSELEEEELRKKLAEENDESLAEEDLSEEKEIRAVALYDYEATESDEISFLPGDIIGRIEKVDSGWWRGTVVDGDGRVSSGLFPANYVEELN